jgi:hypothetical protein
VAKKRAARGNVAALRADSRSSAWLARSIGDLGAAREIEREWVAQDVWQKGSAVI